MKRKLILLCALLIMFLPALKVDATVVSDTIAKKTPVKSTKYESSGLNYIMYLQIPKSLLGDYQYDETFSYDEEEDNYGFEMSVYFFKNKKRYKFDSLKDHSSFYEGNNKVYCMMYAEKRYAGNQGFAYKYRYYVIDENGNKTYSKYSKETVVIPYVTGPSSSIAQKGSTRVSWQKMKGAKSYTVYTCMMNGKNKKKVITTTKNYATINTSKFKKNKCYYYYVKANGVKYKNKRYSTGKFDVVDYCNLLYVMY